MFRVFPFFVWGGGGGVGWRVEVWDVPPNTSSSLIRIIVEGTTSPIKDC